MSRRKLVERLNRARMHKKEMVLRKSENHVIEDEDKDEQIEDFDLDEEDLYLL